MARRTGTLRRMPAALLMCLVIAISDGDTLTARCDAPGGPQNLKDRLAEIDAPREGATMGARSKQLAQLCFGRPAEIRRQTVDRYGRSVARITCAGVDANAQQVRAGMAWVFERYAKDRSLLADQDAARASRRGLWADSGPVAPWDWRARRRSATTGSLGAFDGRVLQQAGTVTSVTSARAYARAGLTAHHHR